MSIKFASVKNFTFPPTPKSLCFFLEIMTRMVDLPIVHFYNPFYNSFLEKYHLQCVRVFCARNSSISLDMYIESSFRKKIRHT